MFCPRCSHQQTSDSARYCTKCGFQISAVKELVANDGVLPAQVMTTPSQSHDDLDRRTRKRSRIINIVLLIAAISFLSDLHNGTDVAPRVIVASVLIAILFARYAVKVKHSIQFTKATEPAVSEPQTVPAQQTPKRIVTAEMVPVPSVTEGTTKLLVNQPRDFE